MEYHMKNPHAPKVRAFLRSRPDGATLHEIAAKTGVPRKSLRCVLHNMPDTYIDRWRAPVRGQYQSIWCIVVPPADCPNPQDRMVRTVWARAHYLPVEMRA